MTAYTFLGASDIEDIGEYIFPHQIFLTGPYQGLIGHIMKQET